MTKYKKNDIASKIEIVEEYLDLKRGVIILVLMISLQEKVLLNRCYMIGLLHMKKVVYLMMKH